MVWVLFAMQHQGWGLFRHSRMSKRETWQILLLVKQVECN